MREKTKNKNERKKKEKRKRSQLTLISFDLQRMITPIQLALTGAGLDVSEIDEVVLIGGSTRIPVIQQR